VAEARLVLGVAFEARELLAVLAGDHVDLPRAAGDLPGSGAEMDAVVRSLGRGS
jgi:hypothetical protein